MALVLTLRTGEAFFVAAHKEIEPARDKFTMSRIVSEDKVTILRHRDKILFEVTIYEKTEIDDDVVAQLGDRITTKAARVAIDAPRSILIVAEDRYRAPKK
jgi:hypothetical protein